MSRPRKAPRSREAPIDPTFLLGLAPVVLPCLLALGIVLSNGQSWPRNIAPGSGLKLWGLTASTLTAAGVWIAIRSQMQDARAIRFAALICVSMGLMAWPVWAAGVLPSVNGISLPAPTSASMRLDRLETTSQSRQRGVNHWAGLTPIDAPTPLSAGRYFISQELYERWSVEKPHTVIVDFARGQLGAVVVLGYRPGPSSSN